MLDRLEALSYVERVSDPQDRCAVLIARTDKDRALEAEYWRVSAEMMRVFYAGFSPSEMNAFERYLMRVLENLSKAEGAPPAKKVM